MDMARRTKIHPLPLIRRFQFFLYRLRLVRLLTMVCISCTPISISSIQAQTLEESIVFNGKFSNNWRDVQNWGIAMPGEFSEVFIDSGSVLVTEFGIAQQVFVGTGQPAQLNIQDGNFSVSNGLVVGEFGNLEINGGSSQIGSIAVNGILDLNTESTFSGLVNVSGGSLQTNNIVLGEMAGTYGELSVAGGNVLAAQVIVGQGIGSFGTIGVTDGVLQADTFTVGAGGSGSVNQVGGHVFVRQWEWGLSEPQVGKLTVGDGEESTGEYTLAGGVLNLSGGEIHISSTGSFEHSGGHLTDVGSVLNEGFYTVSAGEGKIPLITGLVEFTQTTAGALSMAALDIMEGGNLDDPRNSILAVDGTASLDGTLNLVDPDKHRPVSYTDPATRGTADDIVLIEAGNIVGAFETVNYAGEPLTIDFVDEDGISFRSYVDNGLFRNLTYNLTYEPIAIKLQNLLALRGDANGDA